LGFLASILLSLAAKPKAGSKNPSTTLRTGLSQPEPIAMMGSFQNVPPDDNNCPLSRVVHFELLIENRYCAIGSKTSFHYFILI